MIELVEPPNHLHHGIFFSCGNGEYGIRCSFCSLYLGELKLWVPDRDIEFATTIRGKKYPKKENAQYNKRSRRLYR
jgi:hypothetical protein